MTVSFTRLVSGPQTHTLCPDSPGSLGNRLPCPNRIHLRRLNGGNHLLVDSDHAKSQALHHPESPRNVAGKTIACQAGRAIVRDRDLVFLAREMKNGAMRPRISSSAIFIFGVTLTSTVGSKNVEPRRQQAALSSLRFSSTKKSSSPSPSPTRRLYSALI